MDKESRLLKIILIFITIIAAGVAGYMAIEGWPFLDALFMTIITVSTVGYEEVYQLSQAGQWFSIVLIVAGVGSFFYIITLMAEYIVAGHLEGVLWRKKMNKRIDELKGHYIICGFGRVGQEIAHELTVESVPFVIIEQDEENLKVCQSNNYLFISGNASFDDILTKAGISRAKGLVTCVDSDADNVLVTLSARSLNKDIFIIARDEDQRVDSKLITAGANRVIHPHGVGGKMVASLLLRPAVVDFLDVVMHSTEIEFFLEEVIVKAGSPFIGSTLVEARMKCLKGANLLAVQKYKADEMIVDPTAASLIDEGDCLVAIGTKEQLKQLEGLL